MTTMKTKYTKTKCDADNLLLLQLQLADEALDIVLDKYEDLMSGIEGLVNLYAIGNLTAQEALNGILLKITAAKQERDYHSKSTDSGYAEFGYLPSEYERGVRGNVPMENRKMETSG